MVDNGTQVMITDDLYGYYVTGTTVTRITDADFPTPSGLTYQDGYGIISRTDTGRIYISALNDFSSWSLEFSTAAWKADNLKAVYSHNADIFCLGDKTLKSFSPI